ncbi:Tol-Pal system beta propeller repeat protein TolB [Candidatus Bandiella euplotis]|uniref:Tol-Pal system protein TolB n=1 Tax=Candidatus Bandiella euplotis TaxID=1664265 RepID=A0ABZ0ULY4_9RICK|nr:Tol-Pal system beta propeller repeat protein TolB [Candidatus Bandiella woodruffii]WPX97149.1 Protein TolB [Candidatus Bandiella woodruffii]
MKDKKILICLLAVIFNVLIACTSYAKIEVNIDDGVFEPFPIAIAEFEGNSLDSIQYGIKLRTVLVNDLEKSGLFRVIDNDAFLEAPSNIKTPVFANWRTINANMLVVANVQISKETNKIEVSYKLWDPFKEKLVDNRAKTLKIDLDSWRRVAHRIANNVYREFLGVNGYFDSMITFVSEKGVGKRKTKRLAIMDQDGANLRFLTDGKKLVLSPRFDPKSHRIIYMSFEHKYQPAKVYILNLETGRHELVGDMPGMSFAPHFAPDGNYAIMSLARKGTTNIYEVHLTNGAKKKLTHGVGTIDTSPSYSPDGKYIVFNSDRSGPAAQIYIMDRDGGNVRKISSADGRYYTPVWSPDGQWVAFTKILSGSFYIGIMRPDGTDERLLTSSWLEESPSWAPNSRTIIFGRQNRDGSNRLYAIDVDGYNERLIDSSTEASEPSWSAHLR